MYHGVSEPNMSPLLKRLSEYLQIPQSDIILFVYYTPDSKLIGPLKLERYATVQDVLTAAFKKKRVSLFDSPPSSSLGLFLGKGENSLWLENNTPLWLYDLQDNETLQCKTRDKALETKIALKIVEPEQQTSRIVQFEKSLKTSEAMDLFNESRSTPINLEYTGWCLITPEGKEIWMDEDQLITAYPLNNMSVIEYRKKSIIVLEFITNDRDKKLPVLSLWLHIKVGDAIKLVEEWAESITGQKSKGCRMMLTKPNAWLMEDSLLSIYTIDVNGIIIFKQQRADENDTDVDGDCIRTRVAFSGRSAGVKKPHKITKLDGEVVVFFAIGLVHVTNFKDTKNGVLGDILITNYQLSFSGYKSSEADFTLPIACIQRVLRVGTKSSMSGYYLDLICKDLRVIRFQWARGDATRKKMVEILGSLAFPGDLKSTFAFYYNQISNSKLKFRVREEFPVNGWDLFDMEREFNRQAITEFGRWRVTNINKDFKVCDSYPAILAVPSTVSDEQLRATFSFRSRGRIPVLVWVHPKNCASITRCSQPLAGIKRSRCSEDEALIREIGVISQARTTEKIEKTLNVFDARPKANALGNRAMGAGYEDTSTCYPNCLLEFLNIANIHVMRESHEKLREICLFASGGVPGGGWAVPSFDSWLSALDSTHWLDHLSLIIAAAAKVVESVDKQGVSVLLHCSDGWDRTSQLSSLALLCLDSYHRTLEGFECLIEKEWLSFGHKFAQRYGFADPKFSDEQRSPIFPQFLDCVWQLMRQYPSALEFNENALLCILEHLHSCRFGTFLYNSEKDRIQHEVKKKTVSLWSMMNSTNNRANYLNSLYVRTNNVLQLRSALPNMEFWQNAYLSWYFNLPELPPPQIIQRGVNNCNYDNKNITNSCSTISGNNNNNNHSIYLNKSSSANGISNDHNRKDNSADLQRKIENLEKEIEILKEENKRLKPKIGGSLASLSWRPAAIGISRQHSTLAESYDESSLISSDLPPKPLRTNITPK